MLESPRERGESFHQIPPWSLELNAEWRKLLNLGDLAPNKVIRIKRATIVAVSSNEKTTMKASRAILLLLLIAVGPLTAQAQNSTEGIIPPKAVYKVDPVHPPELFEKAIEGTAIIVAMVDLFGSISNPSVESATHEEFGIAAMLAASEWIFEPAMKHGVPLEIQVKIPFKFDVSFEHKLNVELGREVFKKIEVPIIPSSELEEAPLPSFVPALVDFYPVELKGSEISAAISMEFIISPTGTVLNPRIISSSARGFEEAAIRAAAEMRYKPVFLQGQPAYVSIMRPIQMKE